MDYTPHTDTDVARMLRTIGVESVDRLFANIPEPLRFAGPLDIPSGVSEADVLRNLRRLAAANRSADDLVCFLGAGAYDHHVPSMIWPILSRGEFLTSYTPYQPELSQGMLQALFEYQTMVSELVGLEISNASLYDGGSALAEAVHMAAAATGRAAVVLAGAVNPAYDSLLATYSIGSGIEIRRAPWTPAGIADLEQVRLLADGAAAVAVQWPGFFGCIDDLASLADVAHAAGARLVVHADLTALGVLEAPGSLGADIVVAEGQSLGNHLNFGGPYVGVIACGREDVRRLPGRLVGETLDRNGKRAFVLTLQAREQHIRREKATSNICSNETLNAVAVAMALAWLGPRGLEEMGERCLAKAHFARDRLVEVAHARPAFDAPFFKEFCVRLPADPEKVCDRVLEDGVLAGVPVSKLMPGKGLDDALLVAVTEKRTRSEIEGLAVAVARACEEVG